METGGEWYRENKNICGFFVEYEHSKLFSYLEKYKSYRNIFWTFFFNKSSLNFNPNIDW